MESNSVCNYMSDKQTRMTAKREYDCKRYIKETSEVSSECQSRVWLQTELDDTMRCYQLIINIMIFQTKKGFIWS